MKRYILLFICTAFISFTISAQKRQKVGVNSKFKYDQIARINEVVNHLNKNEYNQMVAVLQQDLIGANSYKRQHILNELADIYSYHLLDIERAVEIDKEIRQLGQVIDQSNYSISSTGAHYGSKKKVKNIVLASVEYRNKYVNVSSSEILKISQKRFEKNKNLLKGNKSKANKNYKLYKLEKGISQVKKDLEGAYQGTKDYYRLLSRLIRYEYETYLVSYNNNYIKSYSTFLNGNITLNKIFFKEISFIKLSEYLTVAYNKTKDVNYLELAFLSINKPFLNMKEENNKITYSVLVNQKIDAIVTAYHNKKEYPNFLFFSSLNKARVLAEKTLGDKELLKFDTFERLQEQKNKFARFLKQKIQKNNYLDIYVQNSFSKEKIELKVDLNDEKEISLITEHKTRGILNNVKDANVYYSKPLAIYVTTILKDKITITKVIDGGLKQLINETHNIAKLLIKSAGDLGQSQYARYKREFLGILSLNDFTSQINDDIYISANDVFANLPISYLIDKTAIRNLNMFMFSDLKSKIPLAVSDINILGLFNPNPIDRRNLVGAEKEYTVIDSIFPNNNLLFKREQAKKELLKQNFNKNINIFHFSGHGHNNNDPNKAGLEFLGKKEFEGKINTNEYNLLSLSEMKTNSYKNIKDKELVFLAACQVGVSSNNEDNDAEISGLIRPMLANKNAILSLWNVNDDSTLEFVELFYASLKKSGNIHYSFKSSVKEMKNRYRNNTNLYAPFYLINTSKEYVNFK
ncbi:CHAT domain-containing protein [Polaribacter sp. R77954]|uniref:CHAT domain-containing protein n=1 Tax=Polaribacter sp. R77954 TaxID=3093870 RepID=UPI0037C72D4B